ncbi:MAG: PA domain-containing protein [Paraburkholderia tropica]
MDFVERQRGARLREFMNALPQCLLRTPPVQRFRAVIPERHSPFEVHDQHGVVGQIQHVDLFEQSRRIGKIAQRKYRSRTNGEQAQHAARDGAAGVIAVVRNQETGEREHRHDDRRAHDREIGAAGCHQQHDHHVENSDRNIERRKGVDTKNRQRDDCSEPENDRPLGERSLRVRSDQGCIHGRLCREQVAALKSAAHFTNIRM